MGQVDNKIELDMKSIEVGREHCMQTGGEDTYKNHICIASYKSKGYHLKLMFLCFKIFLALTWFLKKYSFLINYTLSSLISLTKLSP